MVKKNWLYSIFCLFFFTLIANENNVDNFEELSNEILFMWMTQEAFDIPKAIAREKEMLKFFQTFPPDRIPEDTTFIGSLKVNSLKEEGVRSQLGKFFLGAIGQKDYKLYPYNSYLYVAMQWVNPSMINFLCSNVCINDTVGSISNYLKKAKTPKERIKQHAAFARKKWLTYKYLIRKNAYGEHALHAISPVNIELKSFDKREPWKTQVANFYAAVDQYLEILYKQKNIIFNIEHNKESWEDFLSSVDRNGKTIVDKAIACKDYQLMGIYAKYGYIYNDTNSLFEYIKNAIDTSDNELLTSLLAYANKDVMEKRTTTSLLSGGGDSLLHYALKQKKYRAFLLLLNHKDANYRIKGEDGNTILHLLASKVYNALILYVKNKESFFSTFLALCYENGIDIEKIISIKNNNGDTALSLLAKKDEFLSDSQIDSIVDFFNKYLSNPKVTVRYPNSDGLSLLFKLAWNNDIEAFKKSFNVAEVMRQDQNGDTLLHFILRHFDKEVVSFIGGKFELLQRTLMLIQDKNGDNAYIALKELLEMQNDQGDQASDILKDAFNEGYKSFKLRQALGRIIMEQVIKSKKSKKR